MERSTPEGWGRRFGPLPLLLPVFAAVLLVLPFRGYQTDDTFIYLQYARNLAAGSGFSFNPGEPSYGFTSPLWTVLLALGLRAGLDPVVAAKALGFLFLTATMPVFWLASGWFIGSRRLRLAALLVWSANAWMLRWALSGLETPMAVFLALAAVHLWIAARRRDRDPWGASVLLGLAALARPECLGLLGVAVVDVLLFDAGKRLRRLGVLAVGAGVLLVPWALYAQAVFGHFLPNTVFAKGGAFELTPAGLARTVRRVVTIVGATTAVETALAVAGVVAALRTAARRRAVPEWLRLGFLPAAWTVALLGLYTVRSAALVSRYLLPAICWLVIFGFAAVSAWLRRWEEERTWDGSRLEGVRIRHAFGDRTRRLLPPVVTALILVQNLVVLYRVNLPGATGFTRGLQGSLVEIGLWLRENTPAEATVAIPDIGAVGYFGERRIIDVSGLITPEMLPLNRAYEVSDFTARLAFAPVARPDILIDRSEEAGRLAQPGAWPEVCEPIFSREIGDLGIARPGRYVYTVYRMRWENYRPDDAR